jgi:hypothetical protein
MPNRRILRTDLGGFLKLDTDWSDGAVLKSLVHQHVLQQVNDAIDWYRDAKRFKKLFARCTRFLIIIGGAVAAALPTISEIWYAGSNPPRSIPAGWSAIILGGGAALLLLDKFLGFSSGWVRFTSAQLKLRELVNEFNLTWESERASLRGKEPNEEKLAQMLARCKSFLMQADAIVRDETQGWVQEFQETLKMLDETQTKRTAASEPGALNLTVMNGDRSIIRDNGHSTEGWLLSIDDMDSKIYTGTSAGVPSLLPGRHKVRVAGSLTEEVGGQPVQRAVQAEKVVTVPTGGICEETLELK